MTTINGVWSESEPLHGKEVASVTPLQPDDTWDWFDVGPMYRVVLVDGTELTAWPEELDPVPPDDIDLIRYDEAVQQWVMK